MKRVILLVAVCAAVAVVAVRSVGNRSPATATETLRSAAPAETPTTLQLRLLAAESTYWREQYDSAHSIWTALLSDPATIADSAAVAEIRTWLSLAEWRLGDYAAARRNGEFALALKQRLELGSTIPNSYNALGLIAWTEGRLDDAMQLFTDGLQSAKAQQLAADAGKLAGNLGLVATDLAHFDSARAGFEAMLQAGEQNGNQRFQGNALTNLGMLDIQLGNPQQAIAQLRRALTLYQAIEYETGKQNALGQLATAYAAQGQLQSAFALLDSANAVALQRGLRQEVASNLELLGNLYADGGEPRKALDHYSRAQTLNGELGLELERGTVLRKIAELQERLGIRASAVASATEAARIHQAAGARFDELRDRSFLAERAGSLTSRDFVRTQELAAEIASPGAQALAALVEARIALSAGQRARALSRLARDSVALARAGFDVEAEAEQLRARALAAEGRLPEAIAAATRSITILERVRASIGSATLRASFAGQRTDVYALLIGYQLRAGDADAAFRAAALVHSREVGLLSSNSDGAARSAAAMLLRVQHLMRTLKANEEEDDTSSGALRTRERLTEELRRSRAEYESLVARSSWSAGAVRPADTRALQRALRPGEAVLQYVVANNVVYGFVVTPAGVRGQHLSESAAGLFSKVRLARAFNSASDDVLANLQRALIEPFAQELGSATRLIIVPHAALSYLPFAALRNPVTKRYLVELYEVEYVPAVETLLALRSAAPISKTPALAAFAPFPRELPASRTEAKSVSQTWGGKARTGKRASEADFASALASSAIVHVSSHAALDAANPMFSFVSMYGSGDLDGRYEVHDVLAMRVRAPLVFLSGCETALGTYDSGDNVSTFTSAFLAAGARAVVATLWRVEDESAAQLATSFYQHLKRTDAAGALALAQREMLHSSRFGKPFYWGAYTLNGDVTFVRGQP